MPDRMANASSCRRQRSMTSRVGGVYSFSENILMALIMYGSSKTEERKPPSMHARANRRSISSFSAALGRRQKLSSVDCDVEGGLEGILFGPVMSRFVAFL